MTRREDRPKYARQFLKEGLAHLADRKVQSAWDCFNLAIQQLYLMGVASRKELEHWLGQEDVRRMAEVIDISAELHEAAVTAQSTDWSIRRLRRLKRDGWKCTKCGVANENAVLHMHHVRWRRDGGSHHFENLTMLCAYCHDDVHGGTLRF